ncbi:MAG: Nucleic-acid-binding protein contains PIN domain-like protein [Microgenomates group bacterium GW2011_GWA1_48_10]|uniref:PIN domain-containing protein n=1 Tax=Candidatus Gottesmanbacteria bacterium RIFCSPHIGHO2_01_FULL_47_48 TaxID=1798381 RepID=A0A1F6A2S5_9BACT|nr:MAG: Nucleic-acid-binding protein contains PIN domain-like protein [Microgenomates group bacterium GW2011_GWA1_48_10]OGG18960.1 MAG: hypothetical protein A2721_02365 [Candidatus Gottesmanbacteria bacterium RIFCSPHIGHO2_01_FULL_47_48]
MRTYFADANIFLRFLLQDVSDQFLAAKGYFDEAKKGEIELVVTSVIFFEVIYVLRHDYGLPKVEIIRLMGSLLSMPFLKFEEEDSLKATLVMWANKNLDLVDCYLSVKAEEQDAEVLTFDERLSRHKKQARG